MERHIRVFRRCKGERGIGPVLIVACGADAGPGPGWMQGSVSQVCTWGVASKPIGRCVTRMNSLSRLGPTVAEPPGQGDWPLGLFQVAERFIPLGRGLHGAHFQLAAVLKAQGIEHHLRRDDLGGRRQGADVKLHQGGPFVAQAVVPQLERRRASEVAGGQVGVEGCIRRSRVAQRRPV